MTSKKRNSGVFGGRKHGKLCSSVKQAEQLSREEFVELELEPGFYFFGDRGLADRFRHVGCSKAYKPKTNGGMEDEP